jgi:UDP-4-amino-4,6-dideoxy-N-acetyl-beta-L-altrosamine N-acetyltransferase
MRHSFQLQRRPLTLSDIDLLFGWRNRPHVAEFQYTDHTIMPSEHNAWLPRALADPTRAYWIVEADGRPIGLCNLADIDLRNRKCDWALYIGEKDQIGRGVGSWIARDILREVFETRGLGKLCCEVLAENGPANALYRKVGFRQEELLRQHVVKNGALRDVVRYAMLRADYLSVMATAHQRKAYEEGNF